ncbi:MAG: ABC transporter permease [Solirubrobacterales bacterium]
MSNLFTEAVLTALVSGALLSMVPLMFASLGESISEQAGVLNIGLEGMMLFGAYAGFNGALYIHSSWVGLLFGALGGMLAAVVMVVLCVWMRLDQIVVGVALFLFAEGVTSLLHGAQFGDTYPRIDNVDVITVPLLHDIPVVGDSIFKQHAIVYLGLLGVFFVHWMLRRSSIGLSLRAAGETPSALDAAGVDVVRTRSGAVLVCGALAGIGGAYLSIIAAGSFTPMMTQGIGFIGIVLAMLARGKVLWVIVLSFLFGVSLSISTALQLAGVDISTDVIQMLPYITVIVVLLLFARRSYLPSALALPYFRGER